MSGWSGWSANSEEWRRSYSVNKSLVKYTIADSFYEWCLLTDSRI